MSSTVAVLTNPIACASIPVLFVLLLPVLREVEWGASGATFAVKSEKWSISTLISTAPANACFALATAPVFVYGIPSASAQTNIAQLGIAAMGAGWVVLLIVPLDTVSNTVHYIAVGIGCVGALTVAVDVTRRSRWKLSLSACVSIVAGSLFSAAAVSSDRSPSILAVETIALACVSLFLPVADAFASRWIVCRV